MGRDERRSVSRVRLCVLVIALTPWMVPATGRAAEPAAAATPDAELLEFLGSGDDGDPDLQKYLVKEDDARAKTAKPAPKGADGKT